MSEEQVQDASVGSNDYKLFEKSAAKKFGGVMRSTVDTPKGVGCGSFRTDMALSEPFPLGYMHEIYAQNGVGKTTFALEILGQHQKNGGLVAYLDAEGSLNASLVKSIQTLDTEKKDKGGNPLWMYKEAIIEDEEDPDVSRTMTGEEILQYVDLFINTFKNAYIVVDSVDAIVPEAILVGKDIGEATMGKHAKLMSDACRKFKSTLKKNNNGLIWINQVRENPGKMFGDKETTGGGHAIRFYSCQRIKLIKNEAKENFEKDDNGNILGHLVNVRVVKNKLPTTNYTPYFWLKYGSGIDRARELSELALELGIVECEGRSYFFNKGTKDETKIVGEEKANAYIRNNPDVLASIEKRVMDLIKSK
jgi:recombination protein RecA